VHKCGPVVPLPPEEVRVTIRLDREMMDYFRGGVRKALVSHQTRIDEAVRHKLRRRSIAK
jgi:uncharacterized protein (DUF4415 family)